MNIQNEDAEISDTKPQNQRSRTRINITFKDIKY